MKQINLILCALILLNIGLTGLHAQTVKDISGNVYKTVNIGKQVWMVENLKTTKYRNGDLIGTTTTASSGIESEPTAKYQWAYNGDENYVATYGRLYTWYAVTDKRNVCPIGWHVPTDSEWTTLSIYLGGEGDAGGKLKEADTIHWESPNQGATNESGFTALPSGDREYHGNFSGRTYYGEWWSSTEHSNPAAAYFRLMRCNSGSLDRKYEGKRSGYAVRCLRDKLTN
jgi:uncharacterized protein (TIGR02145 family)